MTMLWLSAVVSLLLSSSLHAAGASSLSVRRYDAIFSFGDSFADTGNNPVVFGWYSVFDPVTRPPYGSTFFGHPTGRNCDGRLVVDFVAERLGVPLLPPFLAYNGSFRRGANFAVGAATALDSSIFHAGDPPPGASPFPVNTSLSDQLGWFESLFFVGEFGFNDYEFFFRKKSMEEIRSFVPYIIETISIAIERLIKHGAKSLVVPGMTPSGCTPLILAMFADQAGPDDYDPATGCLKNPDASIIYADFFSPIMEMVQSPGKFGFEDDVLTICCGGPGTALCGDQGAITCEDPSARLFWDMVHMTEVAYRYIVEDWLRIIESPGNKII
uniref:Esterase n=1 Tax=Oryza glumipatula TaxID=40148 RepID=A0A0D9Y5D6_9ORYZ